MREGEKMLHIIYYRILSSLRNKTDIFWILFFPVILGTCFYAAFSDIYDTDMKFESVPVAVVAEKDSPLCSMLDTLAKERMEGGSEPMLKVTYADKETALELLKNGETAGVIEDGGTVRLSVKENSIEATFLQSILDTYVQTMDMMEHAAGDNKANQLKIIAAMRQEADYIQNKSISRGSLNPYTDYFYALIAMACMYAAFLGLNQVKQMRADLSALGMRKCLAPVHRMKIILGDLIGNYLIQCTANAVLILYLRYVLGVLLGDRLPFIFLTAFAGSLIGLSSGIFIGSIPKISENLKYGISIAFSMLCSFFSGLMVGDIRWKIEEVLPVLNRLNPAAVISDALYALNIYDNYDRFFGNLLILVIMSVLFCVSGYVMVRRENYEQL